jgi:molecular chaperone DnaK
MPIIGIDLGTTYCCVAYIDQHDHAEIVMNTDGQPLTASAVWIDEDNNMVVGQLAHDNAIAFPEDVITMAKRHMGQDIKMRAHGREFTPQEVSAIILKKLKQDAERHLGQAVTDAVITCPAFFGAAETRATEEAGKMAGFNVRRIFPEPAATALAFGFDAPDAERTLLVYDLGGGTFDITLFKIDRPAPGTRIPKITMISTEGDRQLGGADWDTRVVDYVAEDFLRQQGKTLLANALKDKCGSDEAIAQALDTLTQIPATSQGIAEELGAAGLDKESVKQALKDVVVDPRSDMVVRQDLYLKAERAKRALSRVTRTNVVCQHGGLSHRVEVSREKFEELTADLLALTTSAIDRLLAAKGYTADQIDEVLCAGGSTRMTMVREMLERKFPGRVNVQIEPDICVARGAARMAKLIESGGEDSELSLSPHAYGVLALGSDGKSSVYPVILKDQTLPCSSARHDERSRPDYEYGLFYTANDNQTRVVLEVYEFDVLDHKDIQEPEACRKIGSVVIENLPSNRPRGQQIFSIFSMDRSLQLTVEALDVASGKTARADLTIQKDTTEEGLHKMAERAQEMSRLLQDTEVQS